MDESTVSETIYEKANNSMKLALLMFLDQLKWCQACAARHTIPAQWPSRVVHKQGKAYDQ